MFKDLLDILKDFLHKLLSSRLFLLGSLFVFLFFVLCARLFELQILRGEEFQESYMMMTEKTVRLASTRGNIYDRKGNLLAYNKLAYNVTIQDNGDYTRSNDKNCMLLRLVRILRRHGEKVEGDFSVGFDSSGEMVFTTAGETAKRRFISDYYGLKTPADLDKDGKNPDRKSVV